MAYGYMKLDVKRMASAEHHDKLLINMQNKLRRSEARLLSGAYHLGI